MHSDSSQEVQHNQDLSLDRAKHGSLPRQDFGVLEGSRVVRGGGRGRAHHPTSATPADIAGLSDHQRNTQMRQRFGKNGLPPQPSTSTDDSGHFDFMQKGKARWVRLANEVQRKTFLFTSMRNNLLQLGLLLKVGGPTRENCKHLSTGKLNFLRSSSSVPGERG